MRNLVTYHQNIPFKAGEYIDFFDAKFGIKGRCIVVAIDETAISEEGDLELLVASKDPIFETIGQTLDVSEWNLSDNKKILQPYDQWYYTWFDIGSVLCNYTLDTLIENLQKEIK